MKGMSDSTKFVLRTRVCFVKTCLHHRNEPREHEQHLRRRRVIFGFDWQEASMPNHTTRLPACSVGVGRRLLTLFLRAVALLRISTGLVAECFRMMGLIFRREISQCSLSSPADLWESTPRARACRLRILASGRHAQRGQKSKRSGTPMPERTDALSNNG